MLSFNIIEDQWIRFEICRTAWPNFRGPCTLSMDMCMNERTIKYNEKQGNNRVKNRVNSNYNDEWYRYQSDIWKTLFFFQNNNRLFIYHGIKWTTFLSEVWAVCCIKKNNNAVISFKCRRGVLLWRSPSYHKDTSKRRDVKIFHGEQRDVIKMTFVRRRYQS